MCSYFSILPRCRCTSKYPFAPLPKEGRRQEVPHLVTHVVLPVGERHDNANQSQAAHTNPTACYTAILAGHARGCAHNPHRVSAVVLPQATRGNQESLRQAPIHHGQHGEWAGEAEGDRDHGELDLGLHKRRKRADSSSHTHPPGSAPCPEGESAPADSAPRGVARRIGGPKADTAPTVVRLFFYLEIPSAESAWLISER